jgi:AraC-like DNA-binding protein/uncharacterized damage-inducible protein DinB
MDTANKLEADRLSLILLGALDEAAGTQDLAKKAYQSRAQFYRLFQALVDESPGGMRRRLRLERAAYQLGRTAQPVTDIAFDAQFGSLEAFSRAFRKAFLVSPSLYRRSGATRFHLPAPNHYHFLPHSSSSQQGASNDMDLFELFAGTESWYTRRLLQQAAALNDEQLDRPVHSTATVFGWDQPDQNLREILERIVMTKEVWAAALSGGDAPKMGERPLEERSPTALLERFEHAESDFLRIMQDVRKRGAWNETFVDTLCEPAETFSYGGMFAHVITFNAHRRLNALDAFHRLGVQVQGTGCPMDYEQAMGERGCHQK